MVTGEVEGTQLAGRAANLIFSNKTIRTTYDHRHQNTYHMVDLVHPHQPRLFCNEMTMNCAFLVRSLI